MKQGLRDWSAFAGLQLMLCLFVFGSALWGARLLAPLDIAPALFPAYRFVDPSSDGIPDNHYVIDQLNYDLPLQTVIYESYRRGEIPWWDPYTYAGRPLLADAHINGTDPIRVLVYLLLPFVPAYNWNLILHFMAAAAGMFALLRYWRFSLSWSLLLASAWQFSGAFVMYFGHPWIGGTFLWLPFLWLVWERSWDRKTLARGIGLSGLLCAAAFYSGNPQSHIYIVIFALVFVLAHLERDPRRILLLLLLVGSGGLLGALIASPVLANQLEFFLISTRETAEPGKWWHYPSRLAFTAAGIFPWMTGSFRTLDLGRLAGAPTAAWVVFCGSATMVFALVGLLGAARIRAEHRRLWKTATGLVIAYLVIVATPLVDLLYFRSAGLAVLGLVPLAALGASLLHSSSWLPLRKIRATGLGVLLAGLISLNGFAFIVYPRLLPSVQDHVAERDARAGTLLGPAAELRRFQVRNLPREISLLNPETLASAVAVALALIALGSSVAATRQRLLVSALAVNLLPVILFATRYIPDHPVEMWQKLQAGGPAQKEVIASVAAKGGRILDEHMGVFPLGLGALYRVHTLHGYSALQPPGINKQPEGTVVPPGGLADIKVSYDLQTGLTIEQVGPAAGLSRLRSAEGHASAVAARNDGVNSLVFEFDAPPTGELLWTDTAYPGWSVKSDRVELLPAGIFTKFRSSGTTPEAMLRVNYSPLHLGWTLAFAAAGLVFCLALFRCSSGEKPSPATLRRKNSE
jgi:hypothetical protein